MKPTITVFNIPNLPVNVRVIYSLVYDLTNGDTTLMVEVPFASLQEIIGEGRNAAIAAIRKAIELGLIKKEDKFHDGKPKKYGIAKLPSDLLNGDAE